MMKKILLTLFFLSTIVVSYCRSNISCDCQHISKGDLLRVYEMYANRGLRLTDATGNIDYITLLIDDLSFEVMRQMCINGWGEAYQNGSDYTYGRFKRRHSNAISKYEYLDNICHLEMLSYLYTSMKKKLPESQSINYRNRTEPANKEEEVRANSSEYDSYYENKIRGLLRAEDKRNFEEIIEYYDFKNITRYWDYYSPSPSDLTEAYLKSWKTISSSSNKVNYISKERSWIFNVNLDFTFYHIKRKEWKTVNSDIKFVFGQNGKITAVYGIK